MLELGRPALHLFSMPKKKAFPVPRAPTAQPVPTAPQQQHPARSSGHQLSVRHAVSCNHTNMLLDFSFSFFLSPDVSLKATLSPGFKGLCWPTPPKPQNFLCLPLSLACSLPRSFSAHFLTLADSPAIPTTCAYRYRQKEVPGAPLRQQGLQWQVPRAATAPGRVRSMTEPITEPGEP